VDREAQAEMEQKEEDEKRKLRSSSCNFGIKLIKYSDKKSIFINKQKLLFVITACLTRD